MESIQQPKEFVTIDARHFTDENVEIPEIRSIRKVTLLVGWEA